MRKLPQYRRGKYHNGLRERVAWQLSKHPMTGRELSPLFHMSLSEFNASLHGGFKGETAVIERTDPVKVGRCTDYTYTLISTKRVTRKCAETIVISARSFGMAKPGNREKNIQDAQRRARLINAGLWVFGTE